MPDTHDTLTRPRAYNHSRYTFQVEAQPKESLEFALALPGCCHTLEAQVQSKCFWQASNETSADSQVQSPSCFLHSSTPHLQLSHSHRRGTWNAIPPSRPVPKVSTTQWPLAMLQLAPRICASIEEHCKHHWSMKAMLLYWRTNSGCKQSTQSCCMPPVATGRSVSKSFSGWGSLVAQVATMQGA